MVISSLNLYEFSMANNKEMGVLIDKNDPADFDLYNDALNEVEYINQTSQRFELTALQYKGNPVKADNNPTISKTHKQPTDKQTGYCIRSGVEIPFNIERPFSLESYKEWGKFNNPEYSEKFCHFSGETSNGETSLSRPILKKNWKKATEIFGYLMAKKN